MAKYCSTEARKIIDAIEAYGIELPPKQYFDVEQIAGTFWPNQVQQVIDKVVSPDRLDKIKEAGFDYFKKPILSMLSSRPGAHRTTRTEVPDFPETRAIYNAVTESLCLVDFNMDELRILTNELPVMVGNDILFLSRAIDACRRAAARSVFYLHGVIKRDYQTARGKVKEAQEEQANSTESAWQPPEGFDSLDVVERRELKDDWQDRLNSIKVSKSLNDV